MNATILACVAVVLLALGNMQQSGQITKLTKRVEALEAQASRNVYRLKDDHAGPVVVTESGGLDLNGQVIEYNTEPAELTAREIREALGLAERAQEE